MAKPSQGRAVTDCINNRAESVMIELTFGYQNSYTQASRPTHKCMDESVNKHVAIPASEPTPAALKDASRKRAKLSLTCLSAFQPKGKSIGVEFKTGYRTLSDKEQKVFMIDPNRGMRGLS